MDGAQSPAPDNRLDSAVTAALSESRARYKSLVEMSADFCWETDAAGRFSFVSPAGALGYRAEELVGRDAVSLLAEANASFGDDPFRATQPVDGVDIWVRPRDGALACLEVTARPFFDRTGSRCGVRGLCRDVTEERERARTLARVQVRERMTARILQSMRDEVVSQDMLRAAAETLLLAASGKGCVIFDFGNHDDIGGPPAVQAGSSECPPPVADAVKQLAGASESEPMGLSTDGLEALVAPTFWHGVLNGAVTIWRTPPAREFEEDDPHLVADVALHLGVALHQIGHQRELEYLSTTDGLTGLLNRRAFTRELAGRLTRPTRSGGALFYVDLDNFKPINDVHGHEKGDEALVRVADLLRATTRPGDLVARLGGDEFGLWLDRADKEAAGRRADRLIELSAGLRDYSGSPDRPLGFSIGVAISAPGEKSDIDTLTARADAAMYQVKHNGKGGTVIAQSIPPEGEG